MSTRTLPASAGPDPEAGDTAASAAALQPPSVGTVVSIAGRQLLVGLRFLIAMTIILGIAYPLLVLGLGKVVSSSNANGSLVTVNGKTVGSSLIGQSFTDDKWFQGRPSAAGKGYDPTSSGGTNLSADSQALLKAVNDARAAIAKSDGVPASQVPPDAVTSSGSGLDPDISEAYALIQVDRVAKARGLDAAKVHDLVESNVTTPVLGFIGTRMVNVLQLNIAVQNLSAG
ncbi:potassium-transporting ATPase subunit KdpC [Nakamurella sp. PAMC28650]|jgi:K+-transporting ATPase ATPase C chain|uniref:potassium-transporting ATPase subunit KdpC n=1 Tax=Nakamurella sp. PAMC28650 TaxID=2762325 RepID=UPI00164DA570|nr:potassium-transporting ATPase subunit KdpC [Nakamurella sp. PAMC28650]QNK83120.1 potassium-transporting ATPase subunit KdpC [Nakamurella sp. PAMC28650]